MEQILFKNKYRIPSSRLKNWNYSWNGCYFVTICTVNKEYFFGEIQNGNMKLSRTGEIANNFWHEIPCHFENVRLDQFIMMPNHIHGIIVIDDTDKNCRREINNDSLRENILSHENDAPRENIAPRRDVALQRLYGGGHDHKFCRHFFSKISPKSGSLSAIIRSYKSICTKTINDKYENYNFAWQSRFHDRIIRNEHELNRIREYIANNPRNWENDRNNNADLWM